MYEAEFEEPPFKTKDGKVQITSVGFTLSGVRGSHILIRSTPDVCWIHESRVDEINKQLADVFAELVQEFH